MERLVILKGQGTVDLGDLPHRIFQQFAETKPMGDGAMSEWEFPRMVLPNNGLNLKNIVDAFENHLIDQALARTANNKNRASELLMMNRTTLVEKLRKRGMITPVGKKMTALARGDMNFNASNENQNGVDSINGMGLNGNLSNGINGSIDLNVE